MFQLIDIRGIQNAPRSHASVQLIQHLHQLIQHYQQYICGTYLHKYQSTSSATATGSAYYVGLTLNYYEYLGTYQNLKPNLNFTCACSSINGCWELIFFVHMCRRCHCDQLTGLHMHMVLFQVSDRAQPSAGVHIPGPTSPVRIRADT